MKKLLSVIYGWISAAVAGGLLLSASSWAYDNYAREYSTFTVSGVLYQVFMFTVWVGIIMIPGVVIALIIRYLRPSFRGPGSLALAILVALVSILGLIAFLGTANQRDIPMLTIFGIVALFVAGLFWWVTLKTDRVEQVADAKPDNVTS
ncbi:MAG: hypothetical protein AAF546_15410 [Verrucomicrobiota bacterium]